jgi:hypothetical protein
MPVEREGPISRSTGYYHYRLKDPKIFEEIGLTGEPTFRWKVFRHPIYALWAQPLGAKPTVGGREMRLQGLRFPVEHWNMRSVRRWLREHPGIDWQLTDEQKKAIREKFGEEGDKLIEENPKKTFFVKNILGGFAVGFLITEGVEVLSRELMFRSTIYAISEGITATPRSRESTVDGEVSVTVSQKSHRTLSMSLSFLAMWAVTKYNPIPEKKMYTFLGGMVSITKNMLLYMMDEKK